MIRCDLGYIASVDAFEHGATLLASDVPAYMREVRRAKVVSITDVRNDPRARDLRAYCSARKISSMLDVPVWVDSKLTGIVCHEHVGPVRRWKPSEVDFAASVAQVVATALEAHRRGRAEEGARRACLLAHASLLLSRSLDERVVAKHAVAATLPLLADWSALDLFRDGTVERLAIQHADPQKQQLLAEYAATYPPRADAPHMTVQAHRLNQSVLIPEVTDETLRTNNFSDEHIRTLRAIGVRSAMAVLIRVSDSIDAVMMFISAERVYDYDSLKFVEEFGERVGTALNNARLYRKTSDALHARDEFLTLAGHELRTPLTSLRMSCERLLSATSCSAVPEIVQTGQRILRQSRRLTRLVNHMLDASLAERSAPLIHLSEVDLVPLVREVVDELASKKQTTIELTLPTSLVGRWDGDRLQQVVGNLIDNAVKYGRDQPIHVLLGVDGESAFLSVVDCGIGIDAETLPHLFGPYERGVSSREYGGLGLGLFISGQIVDAHGGAIEVRSTKGIGSEFRVRLPGVISVQA